MVHEISVFVTHAYTIRVAVRDQQDIGVVFFGRRKTNIDVGRDGFGPDHFGEYGISLIMDFDDFGLVAT